MTADTIDLGFTGAGVNAIMSTVPEPAAGWALGLLAVAVVTARRRQRSR